MRATDKRGVDLIIDMVGGPVFEANLQALAVGGRLVNIARLGGPTAQIDLSLLWLKRLRLIGVTFRTRSIEEIRDIFTQVKNDIWPAVESRKLKLPIDRTFAFDDIVKAFEHMEANRHLGKIVVTLS